MTGETPSLVDRHGAHGRGDLLRIASYNIHGCVGADSTCDVLRVARVIGELRSDTVGLQEVNGRPGALTECAQLEWLARVTGMTAVAGAGLLDGRSPSGNALLTLREVMAVRHCDLSFRQFESRSALDVDLKAAGRVVRLIVTHLGLSPVERRYQVRKLLTLLKTTHRDQPVVVLGDMNEWLPIGRPLRWLHRALGAAPAPRSFPVWAPMLALDRVWSRPREALLAVQAHRSATARQASDHFPVVAVVATGPAQPPAEREAPGPVTEGAHSICRWPASWE
jgi:endonuclease/exonuclease/phosphatase family metal-dependent hydrolase